MAPNRPGSRLRTALTLGLTTGLAATLVTHVLARDPPLAALAAAPLAYRFLMAPPLDRRGPSRRAWLRAAVGAALALTALLGVPADGASRTLLALATGLTLATLANAVDGYRLSILRPRETGPAAAVFLAGQSAGAAAGTALGLSLATGVGSPAALVILYAGLLGLASTLVRLPPEQPAERPATLEAATLAPIQELVERPHAAQIGAYLALSMLPATIGAPAASSLADAAAPLVMLSCTLIGLLLGGFAFAWTGAYASLWLSGVCAALAKLSCWAAAEGAWPAGAALALDAVCAAALLAVVSALALTLCRRPYAATQVSLLSGLFSLSMAAAPLAQFVHATLGTSAQYLASALAGVPALILLVRYREWVRAGSVPRG